MGFNACMLLLTGCNSRFRCVTRFSCFFLSGEPTLAFWKPQLSHRYVELALKARLKSQFVLGLNLERNPRGQIVSRCCCLSFALDC